MKLTDKLALKRYEKIADAILNREDFYSNLSDDDLKKQTSMLRNRLKNKEKIDDVLVDAYAVIREADRRILGLFPFRVQVIGAVVLFYGNIAEMKTGEGKTLTATMPMYFSGVIGKGNFLITSNSYLSKRDVDEVGKVYRWLGLTVEFGASDNTDEERNKAKIYSADIVYTTNSSLGFDYLFDNLSASVNKKYIKEMNFALIDEVDAILLDMAQTPLIISGAPKVQSNFYNSSDKIVKILKLDRDFELSNDNKSVWFTKLGIQKMELYFGIHNLLSKQWKSLYRHLVLALKANYLYQKNKDYIVENDKILLLDYTNGRKLPGTKLEAGMHQALEAKESVAISIDSRSMGSITYQNLFRMFHKLSGMTGTAKTNAQEFRETYNIDVLVIPTNKPSKRIDENDRIFLSNEEKILASVERVKYEYSRGRPILIETGSVSLSELYSRILLREGIPHNVLNARNALKEANMVSKAGEKGAVTVATSMAGRGTDIKLGKGVAELGGLLVIGTERMSDIRIDNQLKGRAGRQGEPGSSVFFVSYEDDIVRKNATAAMRQERMRLERIFKKKHLSKGELFKKKNKRYVMRAQHIQENSDKNSRFQTLEFDNILRIQREEVYKTREKILTMAHPEELISEIFDKTIQTFFKLESHSISNIFDFVNNYVDYNFDWRKHHINSMTNKSDIEEFLLKAMNEALYKKNHEIKDAQQRKYFFKIVFVKSLDEVWIDEVDNLQQLKTIITGRNWGQHTPIFEYNKEAKKAFKKMLDSFWLTVCSNLLLSTLKKKKDGNIDVIFP